MSRKTTNCYLNRDPRISPELFFGLVGASGTDLAKVSTLLQEQLKAINYCPHEIKLSKLFYLLPDSSSPPTDDDEHARIEWLMDEGDALRRNTEDAGAVALLGITKLRDIREDFIDNGEQVEGDKDRPLLGNAFIFNSLKNPEEVKRFREIYGDSFFLLSVYSPKDRRIDALSRKIAESRHIHGEDQFREAAKEIIARDEKAPGDRYGQNVRDTFPLADVFFTINENLQCQIERFIHLLFRHPFRTPSIDEYSMFHAQSAAYRSADLSRQIGAVITDNEASIISAGCNEVPKAGGGAVWDNASNGDEDNRDFTLGKDSNELLKHELISEIFSKLKDGDWLSDEKAGMEAHTLAESALDKSNRGILNETRVSSIIEYGRIVHAEMAAITDAARLGRSVSNATLYSTTFPCHMCARHIISAGIRRVVYIEPYPKSLAKQLYPKSISVDNHPPDGKAVLFEPFVGIAPRIYMNLFSITKRKQSSGYIVEWDPCKSPPKMYEKMPLYLNTEVTYLKKFRSMVKH